MKNTFDRFVIIQNNLYIIDMLDPLRFGGEKYTCAATSKEKGNVQCTMQFLDSIYYQEMGGRATVNIRMTYTRSRLNSFRMYI